MKKILSFLLCLMLVIPAVASLAVTEETISKIEFTVAKVMVGQTVADKPKVTVGTGLPYSLVNNSWTWTTSDFQTPFTSDSPFVAGDYYFSTIELQAAEGYVFATYPEIKITGAVRGPCTPIQDADGLITKVRIGVVVQPTYPTVDVIKLTVTPPKAGTTAATQPVITVPSGSLYHIAQIIPQYPSPTWFTENYDILDPSTVFVAGESYLAGVQLETEASYVFSTAPEYSITGATEPGKSGSLSNTGNQYMVILKVTILKETAPAPASDPAPAGETEQVTLKKLKSVKLKAVSAKKLEISWKKLSKKEQKKIQKFEIQYSTDKTFKTGVKTKWAKKGKNSYTIKGLKKNTKYYVRIRAYKKEGNTVYVSKWVTKNKKTKKK